jgi:hypothetical protein
MAVRIVIMRLVVVPVVSGLRHLPRDRGERRLHDLGQAGWERRTDGPVERRSAMRSELTVSSMLAGPPWALTVS